MSDPLLSPAHEELRRRAEVATILVSTEPARGPRGLPRLIVDLDHTRIAATTYTTLGDRLLPFAELTFTAYEVPVENRLGEEGEGLRMTLRGIQASRASLASHAVGLAQAATDAAIAYAKERRQFGRPIGVHRLLVGRTALGLDAFR